VHQLQAEAERVKADNLAVVLKELHRDKLALRQRHVAVARQVSDYNFNNTYQYVIAREDVHLSWLEAALAELGAAPDQVPEPQLPARGKKDSFQPLVTQDAREAGEFVARWRARDSEVTNARHSKMVGVILGETLEQKRFFDQMVAGNEDLLGRRSNGPASPGTGDGVIAERWRE
jgi:Mn-containing catalase